MSRIAAARAPLGTALDHPLGVAALVVLVLNDHVWKLTHPGWVTGKLSDVAGMIVAPLVLVAVLDRFAPASLVAWRSWRGLSAWVGAIAVMLVFVATKTWPPATAAYQSFYGGLRAPFRFFTHAFGRSEWETRIAFVADRSDLIALPFGVLAGWVASRRRRPQRDRRPTVAATAHIPSDWPTRNPPKMPARPPTIEPARPANEKVSAPQSKGIKPPTVDPIAKPSQTNDLVVMLER